MMPLMMQIHPITLIAMRLKFDVLGLGTVL